LPCLVLVLLYPVAALLAGQDISWDQRNYHLYSSLSLIGNSFSSDILPSGVQTFGNPLASLSSAFILRVSAISSPASAAATLALLQGASPMLLYAIGLLLFENNRLLAFFAALIGGTGAFALSEAGNTMADLTISMLPLGSLYLLLLSGSFDDKRRIFSYIALAAGLAGAACGLKLTFIFFLPVSMLALAASIFQSSIDHSLYYLLRVYSRAAIIATAAFCLGGLLFASPMLYHSTLNTGSPIFPYANQIFQSPYHKPINWSDARFKSTSLQDIIIAPIYEFSDSYFPPYNPKRGLSTRRSEPVYRDVRPLLWAIASLTTSFLYIRRIYEWFDTSVKLDDDRFLFEKLTINLGTLLSYGIFLYATGIGRYSIPIQMLFGFVIVFAIQELSPILSGLVVNTVPKGEVSAMKAAAEEYGRKYKTLRPYNSRYILLALTLLTTLIFSVQLTPSWGRAPFEKHWSTVSSENQPSKSQLSNEKIFLPSNAPIVMLNKGYAWIRGALTTENPLYLWDLRQEIEEERVRAKILQSVLGSQYGHFFVLVQAKSNLDADKQVNLYLAQIKSLAKFKVQGCTGFKSFASDKFQICNVVADPFLSKSSLNEMLGHGRLD